MDSGLINKNYMGKVMFLSGGVIIIKLSKDTYKREMAVFNLVISVKVITRNNCLQNTY